MGWAEASNGFQKQIMGLSAGTNLSSLLKDGMSRKNSTPVDSVTDEYDGLK